MDQKQIIFLEIKRIFLKKELEKINKNITLKKNNNLDYDFNNLEENSEFLISIILGKGKKIIDSNNDSVLIDDLTEEQLDLIEFFSDALWIKNDNFKENNNIFYIKNNSLNDLNTFYLNNTQTFENFFNYLENEVIKNFFNQDIYKIKIIVSSNEIMNFFKTLDKEILLTLDIKKLSNIFARYYFVNFFKTLDKEIQLKILSLSYEKIYFITNIIDCDKVINIFKKIENISEKKKRIAIKALRSRY